MLCGSLRHSRFILTALVCVSVINVIYVIFQYDWSRDENHKRSQASDITFLTKGQSNLVCAHPELKLWPDNFKELFVAPAPLDCHKQQEDWVYTDKGKYRFHSDISVRHGEPLCEAIPLLRGEDDFTVVSGPKIKPLKDGMALVSDFSEVKCVGPTGDVFSSLLSGIAANQTGTQSQDTEQNELHNKKLNILMVGFDSVSRLTWLRNLPSTHAYFTSALRGVVLQGYNIVGDGTPQALLPIFTGRNETELAEARRGYPGAREVDGHPWIWRSMRRQGYVTQWGEDGAATGTFTLRMLGFRRPPVQHYMRPFYIRAEHVYGQHRPYCLGARPRHVNMLDWARQLYDAYPNIPKFSFVFHSELSHDTINKLQLVDSDLLSFLTRLNDDEYLNNTVLILMSDHGARFQSIRSTVQGKYEERLPYFGIRVPTWFQQKYPEQYANLVINSQKLSTPYDVHETLLDIIGLRSEPEQHSQTSASDRVRPRRAYSLFDHVPESRTCGEADIALHWCTCLDWKHAHVSDKMVRSAAQEVVRIINSMTHDHRNQCRHLTLKTIKSAVLYKSNEKVLQFKQSTDEDGRNPEFDTSVTTDEHLYQVVVETAPGGGLFEATVKYVIGSNTLYVNERHISRINRYGRQAHCVERHLPHLRPYCYCSAKPDS